MSLPTDPRPGPYEIVSPPGKCGLGEARGVRLIAALGFIEWQSALPERV